ncbi:MAG: hypothetical protein H0T39_03005 [Actinobacteria bacterium]|nr:hypothetical protein [Actinomycetota bacterium]
MLARLEKCRPSALERLEARVGVALTRRLLSALCGDGRRRRYRGFPI